jgi:hypothetical protein
MSLLCREPLFSGYKEEQSCAVPFDSIEALL